MEGKTQETAAAKAGMCVRSARKWQDGPLPSETRQERWWRTRPDPFDGVWGEEIEPLLRGDPKGQLKATTIIEWLEEHHPGRFSASQLRTLQRRLQDWRALHGPDQEVYFPQEHPPGREAQFDFTHGDPLGVTIAGQPYPHLLFQLILSHSGWRYAEVATGETFLALKQGLQAALWTLGGVPEVARSDNTSAATHEMKRSRGRALNDNYAALLDHYGLRSTRINRGQSHENGVAEHAHYRLKDAVDQALILRGSRDFHTTDHYAGFVREMVERRNRLVKGKLEQEMACLRPLPPAPMPEYANYRSKVRKWSTIQVAGRSYSVPSRLIDKEVQIRLYADWVEVYYKGHLVDAWSGCGEREKATSITATSSDPWCASPVLLLVTVSESNCFPRCTSASPTTPSGNGAGSVPTWSTCGSCTWRRPPWRPMWTAPCRCCWRLGNPSTTARCGTWPSPGRRRLRC